MERILREQEKVNAALAEIQHGDLFRRIEFTQGKTILLESMLQRGLLSPEIQRNSEEFRFIERMRSLFPVRRVRSDRLWVRIGRKNDGGYVMLDDFDGSRIAYSIGIADDVSWDRDMALRGLDVYMYDHTIDALPEENERFHFSRTGVCAAKDAQNPLLMTLEQMLESNGHTKEHGMILKIDVEGAEWDVLNDLDEEVLMRFSQIVFEFHAITDFRNEDRICAALNKLNATHQLAHIHANNYGTYRMLGGLILPELIEGTYLLKDEYAFDEGPQNPAQELDMISCPYLADVFVGNWNAY